MILLCNFILHILFLPSNKTRRLKNVDRIFGIWIKSRKNAKHKKKQKCMHVSWQVSARVNSKYRIKLWINSRLHYTIINGIGKLCALVYVELLVSSAGLNLLYRDILWFHYITHWFCLISLTVVWFGEIHLKHTWIDFLLLIKKAIRTVCNVPFNNHTNNLFVECKTLKVSDLVLMYTYIFMYHYHTNALPDMFNDLFSTNASYHSYFTRQYADLHQFLPKTTISQNSLITL